LRVANALCISSNYKNETIKIVSGLFSPDQMESLMRHALPGEEAGPHADAVFTGNNNFNDPEFSHGSATLT